VGTIENYWKANMDLLGRHPRLDLFNKYWPVYAANFNTPPGCVVGSTLDNSLLSEGAHVFVSTIKNSILGRAVKIEEGCLIEDSIIMDYTVVRKNSRIRRAVIDRFNVINKNSSVGFDKAKDSRDYYRDPSGIVVVRRGLRKETYY